MDEQVITLFDSEKLEEEVSSPIVDTGNLEEEASMPTIGAVFDSTDVWCNYLTGEKDRPIIVPASVNVMIIDCSSRNLHHFVRRFGD